MKRDIDDLLNQALSPDMTPDPRLNQRILNQKKENRNMNTTTDTNYERRPRMRVRTAMAVAICCVLAVGSVTTYAAWKLLSAKDVAAESGDQRLAKSLTGKDAILVNESQTCGNYRITLLGAAAGENISDYLGQDTMNGSGTVYVSGSGNPFFESSRLCTIVAIEHADGTPMPDTSDETYGDETFLVSPYIKGLPPQKYNAFTLNGSYADLVIDGVLYRILETTNAALFADHGVCIGVSDGTFYNQEAFLYDDSTGEITRNESYTGVNALFTLPLDSACADPEAAQALLDTIDHGAPNDGGSTDSNSPNGSFPGSGSSGGSTVSSSPDTASVAPGSSAVQETAVYLPAKVPESDAAPRE